MALDLTACNFVTDCKLNYSSAVILGWNAGMIALC